MKTSFHRMYTSDNIELVGLLYEPENPTNKILVHVHGMAGNFYENLFLDFLAKNLTDNGIAFFAFNNRGCEFIKDLMQLQGDKRKIVRIGDAFERFEDSVIDIRTAIDFVEKRGFSHIQISGHSLGSSKVAYYVAEGNDDRIRSVIFLSPADMVGLAKMDENYKRDLDTASRMIAEGKGSELMPFIVWGDSYLSANTYMSIGHESSKVAIFNLYNPKDDFTLLGKVRIPTLTIMGKKDGALTVPVEELMQHVAQALKNSSKVETCVLGEANHGYQGHEQPLADRVVQWLKKI